MTTAAAIVAAGLLASIALLHVAWAAGSRWPAHDDASFNALLVGARPGAPAPPAGLTLAIAVVVAAMALAPLGARGLCWVPTTPAIARAGALVAAGVLGARGLGGFVAHRVRPHLDALPFGRWNRRVYSPLCVAIAALLVVAVA